MDTTQLLKGVLDLAVLAVVDGEDGYGYDIVRRLRDGGPDEVGDAWFIGHPLRRLFTRRCPLPLLEALRVGSASQVLRHHSDGA
ncbi:MAG: hypothetical protein R2709_00600 [Marmoricola sp.]